MTSHIHTTLVVALLGAAGLALSACGGQSDSEASTKEGAKATQASVGAGTPSFLIETEPAGAVGIEEAKKSAKEGDAIAVRGRIGGSVNPLSAESAVFMMMDLSEKSCDQLHADQCPTPWDYCCTPRDRITALSCTVQLVDESGNPLAVDLDGSRLEPLDEVVVVGSVAPRPNEKVLVIKATGVYRAGT